MVSVAVSILETTELMFIELGVKINDAYYRDVLLSQNLLPAIRSVAGDFFTSSALAHRRRLRQRHHPTRAPPVYRPYSTLR